MSEKTQALLSQLQTKVSTLTTEANWLEYLKMQSIFKDYSFRNTLLILTQKPDASLVAGFKAWKKLGRHVKKGEKGISILAPMAFKKKSEDGEEKTWTGFRAVHVFDQSQTDGKELPDSPAQRLEGQDDQAAIAFKALKAYAQEELQLTVEDKELTDGVNGYFDRSEKKIVVHSGNADLQKAKTMAHEIGHAILHAEANDSHERPVMEVEAESVAFIVMNHFGIDSGDYSFGYVALWGQEQNATKMIQDSGARIAKAANQVVSSLSSGVQ